jgi:hypothetical protein
MDWTIIYVIETGKGIPIRHVLGKSKMLLGLLEGIPSMLKGEVAMVTYYILILLSFLSINFVRDYAKSSCLYFLESSLVSIYYEITYYCNTLVL